MERWFLFHLLFGSQLLVPLVSTHFRLFMVPECPWTASLDLIGSSLGFDRDLGLDLVLKTIDIFFGLMHTGVYSTSHLFGNRAGLHA